MTRSFSSNERRRMSDAFFAVQEVAQECDMRNRVVEPDPMWMSAIAESSSTLGLRPTRWVDRIRQSYQTLDEGGGRTVQSVRRDPLTGQEIVKCDPTCTYPPCVKYRSFVQAMFAPHNQAGALHCSGCLECTLMDDSRWRNP